MAHFDGRVDIELSGRDVGDTTGEEDTSFTVADVYPDVPLEQPGPLGSRLERQGVELKVIEAVDKYYAELQRIQYEVPEKIAYKSFSIGDDKQLYLGTTRLMSVNDGRPLVLKTNKMRQALGVTRVALPAEATAKLKGVKQTVANVESIELQDLPQAATEVSQAITDAELEKALRERGFESLRDLEGVDKALRRIRGELANKVAKLSEFDREIARRMHKIETAPNEDARKIQESKLKDLKANRRLMFEAALTDRENMRSQFNRVRETIDRVLNEDTTLGERLRTLFREQGITIASILTALGMIISTIVLAVRGGGGATTPPPPPPPPDKPGLKEWVKHRLQDLGRLLGKLAEKAAAALPGIIGSIVSWLLSTAQKAVGWLAENLWALVVGITGMIYLTAKDYIVAKQMRLARAPPKKD